MTEKVMPKDNITNNPEVSFFMLRIILQVCTTVTLTVYLKNWWTIMLKLHDTKGNINKSKIQHVWVGRNLNVSPVITFTPEK